MKCYKNIVTAHTFHRVACHVQAAKATQCRNSSTTQVWLNRQRRDPFVKARGNYRSRSAFKLIQMNDQYNLFPKSTKAKGSVYEQKTPAPDENENYVSDIDEEEVESPRVIGVDLLATDPLLGARFLQGDFLDVSVQQRLQGDLGGRHVDMILSDMSPHIRGNRIADIEASLELCRSVLAFTQRHLRPAPGKDSRSGTLILKHFSGPAFEEFREKELTPLFSKKIKYAKPEASRQNSSEAYFVCQGYKGHTI
ncbi:hypothetical protein PIIN_07167 [Serendipita indica DSM 11827]|uniref:rRNA methyltransferase 2, mitochondrial n=1 Tax=Serendipita indica (strain DSM 11827) TaxID=1109443 RepID=G4TPH0_SERID|nr:hypothetical protein PIIN_07167 [Serendipita indica DSM 11827]